MRTIAFAATLLTAAALAPAAVGAVRDDAASSAATRWLAAGDAALAAKKSGVAIDAFEAALAVDPKSAPAFVGIAKAYSAEALPGKAIRFYREALALQPNDLDALAGQGEAMVARGATTRARVNLDRIKTLCKTDCPAAKRLETALAAPPPPALAKTASVDPVKPDVAKN